MGRILTISTWFFVLGALGGTLLASWIAPGAIAWYFEPPVEFGVSCGEPIRWALQRFRRAQLWGMLAGGSVATAPYLALRRGRGSESTA
jgi:hypothetical protein